MKPFVDGVHCTYAEHFTTEVNFSLLESCAYVVT